MSVADCAIHPDGHVGPMTEGRGRGRNVVIEFPSFQAAKDCYNSPEYQAAKAIRVTVADADMVIVEGR